MRMVNGKALSACVVTLAALFMVAIPTSCSAQKQIPPDAVLKSYFAAVKSQDTRTMQSLSIDETSSTSSSASTSSSSATDNKDIVKMIYGKMSANVEGSPTINGDNATVKAKITSPDTKKIMQDCMTAAFSTALSNAFSDSGSSDSNNDTSSEFTKTFTDEISKSDVLLTTSELNVSLVKKDGQWKVKVTDNLCDAMAGGIFSYAKSVSNSLSSTSSAG